MHRASVTSYLKPPAISSASSGGSGFVQKTLSENWQLKILNNRVENWQFKRLKCMQWVCPAMSSNSEQRWPQYGLNEYSTQVPLMSNQTLSTPVGVSSAGSRHFDKSRISRFRF